VKCPEKILVKNNADICFNFISSLYRVSQGVEELQERGTTRGVPKKLVRNPIGMQVRTNV
jgi:hypothetical protein